MLSLSLWAICLGTTKTSKISTTTSSIFWSTQTRRRDRSGSMISVSQ